MCMFPSHLGDCAFGPRLNKISLLYLRTPTAIHWGLPLINGISFRSGGRSAISTKTRQFPHHNNFSGLLRTDWCRHTFKGQWIPPRRAKLAWSNIKLCAPSLIYIKTSSHAFDLENCIAQKSLKELMVAAFQKPNRRLNVTSAAVKSVGSASLQPSSIDWLDKCMFPDISLRLCVQMMMLVSRGIGGHLLPWHAVAGGEQCEGVVRSQGKNGLTQTDKQTDNQ